MQKTALVLGAGGFIGNHMVNQLKKEGYWVRAVDLKFPDFTKSEADQFITGDLRDARFVYECISYAGCYRFPYQIFNLKFDEPFDEIYQFAADMGGAGYIFTGEHDADIMHNSASINLNVLDGTVKHKKTYVQTKDASSYIYPRIFYSSSACMYPEHNQEDPDNPVCKESTAYPANPDSEYGWEKLFSERLFLAYNRNYGIPVRVARYHNIYGPLGTWKGGKEKAPAAICRKVITADDSIEVWGDGKQTRSFLYINDCINATRTLMRADHFMGPVNIGSEEMVSINQLVEMVAKIEEKKLTVNHIQGPTGVRGRNSHNELIEKELGWKPNYSLEQGLKETYEWIKGQVMLRNYFIEEQKVD